jgi:hypothetical protein
MQKFRRNCKRSRTWPPHEGLVSGLWGGKRKYCGIMGCDSVQFGTTALNILHGPTLQKHLIKIYIFISSVITLKNHCNCHEKYSCRPCLFRTYGDFIQFFHTKRWLHLKYTSLNSSAVRKYSSFFSQSHSLRGKCFKSFLSFLVNTD